MIKSNKFKKCKDRRAAVVTMFDCHIVIYCQEADYRIVLATCQHFISTTSADKLEFIIIGSDCQ